MFKYLQRYIIFLALLIVFPSCENRKNRNSSSVSILLDWLPNPNHVALYAGVQKGIFKKHGVDLDLLKLYDCNDTLSLLNSGHADLAIYYMPSTLQALDQGLDLKVVGTLIPYSLDGFLVKKSANISSPEELKDLVLGNYLSLLDRKLLQHLSSEKGIKFKGIKQIYFDPAASLKADLVQVVSGICWNIEQSQLEAEGVETTCFHFRDLDMPRYDELVILANYEFAEKSPKLLKKFQSALNEAISFCRENPEEAFELYRISQPDKSENTIYWERLAWEKTYPLYPRSIEPAQAVWKEFYQWMKDRNILEEETTIDFVNLFQ